MIDIREVREWLNRYSALMCHADARSVTEFWEMPATLLTDDAEVTMDSAAVLEEHIALEQKHQQATGIASIIPRIDEYDEIGPELIALQVTWTNMDYDDHPLSEDRSHLVLHREPDGKYRVRIATPLRHT